MKRSSDRDSKAPLHRLAEQANLCLAQGDGAAALALFSQILQQDIGFAPAFLGAGLALETMGDDGPAIASYRHAIELDPAEADAYGALAALALKQRDRAAARAWAEQALTLNPDQIVAALTLAQLDLDDSAAAAAQERLAPAIVRGGLAPAHLAQAHRLSADALDRLGRVDEAFAGYAASARILRDQYAVRCGGPEPMAGLDLCQNLVRQYGAAPAALWRPAAGDGHADSGVAGHVFVVGFPRSGTTLLEQVLASHPDVEALEERQTLTPVIDAHLDPPQNLQALIDMDEPAAARWRQVYWDRVKSYGVQLQGKLFVDKQPFYTLWLPLIGKLFPEAKIVVVRRDPRDVVFSCFRRPFRMTPVTYELMDLARSAQLYGGAMDFLDLFAERGANRTFAYRHEDLVEDFDAIAADLCRFLDLGWTDRLRDFAATAKARDIRTPSAGQVVKGLNRQGVGAWRRYADHLRPILPLLQDAGQRCGYEP